MKFLAVLFVLLCAISTQAASFIKATITFTNNPSLSNTIVVNGMTKTWRTNITDASSQILIGANIGENQTNLFTAIGANKFPDINNITLVSSNVIVLQGVLGASLTVSFTGNYATNTYSTNGPPDGSPIVVPASQEPSQAHATNMFSLLAQDIANYGTNPIPSGTISFSKYVTLDLAQSITGNKTYTGANVYSNASQVISGGTVTNVMLYAVVYITGGSITNTALTNVTPGLINGLWSNATLVNIATMSGTLGNLTNGNFTNPVFTNGQNYGAPFRSPGTGFDSENFGTGASASGDNSVAFGKSSAASGNGSVALGNAAGSQGVNSIAIGILAYAASNSSIAIGSTSISSGQGSIALGTTATAGYDYSTAVGYGATSTTTNQVMLGTSTEYVHIPGGLNVDGSITNIHEVGNHTIEGNVSFTQKVISGVVSGGYNLDPGTNTFIRISGPIAAFSLNSIVAGRSGGFIKIENPTGFAMTIENESGFTGTAANRILTGLSGPYTNTNNPGFVNLSYDPVASRWVIESHN